MDKDARELVIRLCTRAGIIMEDASAIAITMPSASEDQASAALERLARDAEQVVGLIAAARAVGNG